MKSYKKYNYLFRLITLTFLWNMLPIYADESVNKIKPMQSLENNIRLLKKTKIPKINAILNNTNLFVEFQTEPNSHYFFIKNEKKMLKEKHFNDWYKIMSNLDVNSYISVRISEHKDSITFSTAHKTYVLNKKNLSFKVFPYVE